MEKERERREQEELARKEKERLLKQEEMKAEIQKLKVAKEEAQRKSRKELEAVKKAGEESAAQIEKREKDRIKKEMAKSQETPTHHEQVKDTSFQIPVMDAIPLSIVLPTRSPHVGETTYLGQAATEKAWNEILTQHGYKPKKQSTSSDTGKAPRGYTKQSVRDFLDRKAAEAREQQEKVAQTPPPPGPGPE